MTPTSSGPATLAAANDCLDTLMRSVAGPLVLEAGGGSHTHFAVSSGARIVTVDIDFGQLARNAATPLRVQGDVHRLPLRSGAFDMAICFNVIEHLGAPEEALAELRQCLRAGGLLVLGFPNRNSLKALVTRATPVGLHRLWYQRITGKPDRGDGHFDAFATVFGRVTALPQMRCWLRDNGFELTFFSAYDGVREYGILGTGLKGRIASTVYYSLCALCRMASLGKWHPAASDVLLIARLAEPVN